MRKKFLIALFLFTAIGPVLYADQCFDWQKTNALLPGDPPEQYYPVSLAFDENVNKMALLTSGWWNNSNLMALWYYDGNIWEKAWEGNPSVDYPLSPPYTLYYDSNLNALICISFFSRPTSDLGLIAFKYNSNNGFMQLAVDVGGICTTSYPQAPSMTFAYDNVRKRAVILGTLRCASDLRDSHAFFVEFDGQSFFQITLPDPLDSYFGGIAGYNTNTRKVVLFGFANYTDREPSTWEYDGSTWINIQTQEHPSYSYPSVESGMTYMPQFYGLLEVDYSNSTFKTWLYDSSWKKIQPSNSPSQANNPVMALNPISNIIIYYDNVYAPPYDNVTWEFLMHHCRSVAKP